MKNKEYTPIFLFLAFVSFMVYMLSWADAPEIDYTALIIGIVLLGIYIKLNLDR